MRGAMTTFSDAPETFERLDYMLLQKAAVSVYASRTVLEQDLRELRRLGYRIDEFDSAGWADDDAMHEEIAAKLNFPNWYGMNLDALADCLVEPGLVPEGGRVLVLYNFDTVAARDP